MKRRRGFTLIELLVVIGVLGVLFALTLPAVQRVRAAAQAARCRSHLRQMGVAIHGYSDTHRILPPGLSRGLSLHVAILPFMDAAELYHQVNYRFGPDNPQNRTVAETRMAAYSCPADPADGAFGSAGTNYAANYGTGFQTYGMNGPFKYLVYGSVRPCDVSDGLAKTVGLSEQLVNDGTRKRLRNVWYTPTTIYAPDQLDELARVCREVDTQLQVPSRGHGVPWTNGNASYTMYNHIITPNQNSCINGGGVREGAYTASSLHGEGVHVMAMDGHVEFVSDSIALRVWRAIGSRNGDEVANWP